MDRHDQNHPTVNRPAVALPSGKRVLVREAYDGELEYLRGELFDTQAFLATAQEVIKGKDAEIARLQIDRDQQRQTIDGLQDDVSELEASVHILDRALARREEGE